MSFLTTGSGAVEQARQILRSECARSMRAGHFTVRIRIKQFAGEAVEARFYFHGVDGWQKQPQRITDRKIVQELEETLDMLLSKGQGDEWLARRHLVSHGYNIDLQFHTNIFAGLLSDQLDSFLDGLLFRDSHDSKKDPHRPRWPRGTSGRTSRVTISSP